MATLPARFGHTTTFVGDSRVVLFGGATGDTGQAPGVCYIPIKFVGRCHQADTPLQLMPSCSTWQPMLLEIHRD